MSQTETDRGSLILRAGELWRQVAAVSALALLSSLVALAAAAPASAADPAYGGYSIDGVPPVGGAVDPVGSGIDELGVRQGQSNPKLGDVHVATMPTLGLSDPNNSADLSHVYLDARANAENKDVWLYFAWEREDNTGSAYIMFEFQKNPPPPGCDYTKDTDFLIDNCNPWAGRQAGDFVIVWDQQGNDITIGRRTWSGSGAGMTLGALVELDVAGDADGDGVADLAAAVNDGRTFGEAAINLSAFVFGRTATSCTTIANVIPMTVTGNSPNDSADIKDAVLVKNNAFISNCAELTLKKLTEPAGGTESFPVRIARSGGGPVGYGQQPATERVGTLVGDGDTETFLDLRAATDYRLTEPGLLPSGYTQKSARCRTAGSAGTVGPWTDVKDVDYALDAGVRYACEIVNFKAAPGIKLEKSVDKTSGVLVGETLKYTVTAAWDTAAGANVPLTGVSVTDPLCPVGAVAPATTLTKVSGDGGTVGTLEAGETWVYECTYQATQDDVDEGGRTNTASGMGYYGGTEVTDTDDAVFTPATGASVLVLKDVRAPGATSGYRVDDVVEYDITVDNTGLVTLTGVQVTDDTCDAATKPVYVSGDTNGDSKLGVSEVWLYRCTHKVTQADVDAGGYTNTAAGSGQPPGSPAPARVSDDDTAAITTASTADMSLTKTVSSPSTGLVAGDAVLYTVKATNSGTTTLSSVSVTDPLCPAGGTNPLTYLSGDSAPTKTMQPGEVWTYTCSYTVPQSDVDSLSTRTNTATSLATAVPAATRLGTTNQAGQLVRTASADIGFSQEPAITVDKVGDVAAGGLGTPVTYTVTATNTGTVTLTGLTVTDPLCTPVDATPDTTLSPGEAQAFTCTRALTQADVDAGSVVNVATGSAFFGESEVTDDGTWTVRAERTPLIDITKTAAPTSGLEAGDPLTYTLAVRNAGNVSLTAVSVTDPLCTPVKTGGDPSNVGVLDVGETWTYSCTYTVTQPDVEAGAIVNVATAKGTGAGTTVTDTDTRTVTTSQTPGIVVDKAATAAADAGAGDPVLYTVTVRNGGNVPLSTVTVTDPLCAPAYQSGDDGDGVLGLTEEWTYTCTYAVTQADVDAGSVLNTATGTGTFKSVTVSDTGSATVPLTQTPDIEVDKSATPSSGVEAGDEVVYTLVVTNVGNVTLTAVAVADPLCIPVRQSGDANGDSRLQVTETWTYTCTYTVTQADVDAGEVENTATASAQFGEATVSDVDTAVVTASQAPGLTITKTPTPTSYDAVGDTIAYTYVVTNSGNTTLAGPITVTDDKATVTCPATTSLAISATVTCTATYVITQADLTAGSVVNVARATNGTVTSPQVTARVDRVAVLSATPTPTPSATPTTPPPAAPETPRVLPFTGAWLLPLVSLGSGAMLVGALLTGAARSRRPERQ